MPTGMIVIRFYNNQVVYWSGEGMYCYLGDIQAWVKVSVAGERYANSEKIKVEKLSAVDIFRWNVVIRDRLSGWFQSANSGAEGTLRFRGKIVVDFDGVSELPEDVIVQLRMRGFTFEKHILPAEAAKESEPSQKV